MFFKYYKKFISTKRKDIIFILEREGKRKRKREKREERK